MAKKPEPTAEAPPAIVAPAADAAPQPATEAVVPALERIDPATSKQSPDAGDLARAAGVLLAMGAAPDVFRITVLSPIDDGVRHEIGETMLVSPAAARELVAAGAAEYATE